jgi:hypothetical protein
LRYVDDPNQILQVRLNFTHVAGGEGRGGEGEITKSEPITLLDPNFSS